MFIDSYAVDVYNEFMYKSIGEKLRSMRKQNKQTLKKVSQKTGLSVSFISDMERGVTDPSLKTIIKLAKFHNITVRNLFLGVEELS